MTLGTGLLGLAWLSRHNLTFQSKTNPRAREWAGAGKKENDIFVLFGETEGMEGRVTKVPQVI